jgi:hypothetical protein
LLGDFSLPFYGNNHGYFCFFGVLGNNKPAIDSDFLKDSLPPNKNISLQISQVDQVVDFPLEK